MKLCLFFTRGISLKEWVSLGLFSREKALYEQHLLTGTLKHVYWITYGADDDVIAAGLRNAALLHPAIQICKKPSYLKGRFGNLLYSLLIPLFWSKEIKSSDCLKTNQIDGSWAAVLASRLYRKKLIVRSGFTVSQQEIDINSDSRLKIFRHKLVEKFAYSHCELGFVSSNHSREYLLRTFNLKADQIKVVPNYIQTTLFKPMEARKLSGRVLYVGRLTRKKNLFALMDATAQLSLGLDLYGQGELSDQLHAYAEQKQYDVRFLGVVPNDQLPDVLNSYDFFVLPSLQEGMPKTLVEAMACGLVCIGTNIEGISEFIQHGYNGFLADGFGPCFLAKAIKVAMSSDVRMISSNAVSTVRNMYSLDIVADMEAQYFDALSVPPL